MTPWPAIAAFVISAIAIFVTVGTFAYNQWRTARFARLKALELLDTTYGQDVQDSLALLGIMSKQFENNKGLVPVVVAAGQDGTSQHGQNYLADFMANPPLLQVTKREAVQPRQHVKANSRVILVQVTAARSSDPDGCAGVDAVKDVFDAMKGQREVWLEVRAACHRLESFWDAYFAQAAHENLPDSTIQVEKDKNGAAKRIVKMKGRWLRRANNFQKLCEPLAKANYLFIHPGEQYKRPDRYRMIEQACEVFRRAGQTDLDLKGQGPVTVPKSAIEGVAASHDVLTAVV